MQTHPNPDHERRTLSDLREQLYRPSPQMDRRERRARAMEASGDRNAITAGEPGEPVLMQAERFGVEIARRPEDPDCLRISVGEVRDGSGTRYLVFRGAPERCADLLERAARALRAVAL